MARDYTEAVIRWRELRTLCGTMEGLTKSHGTAYVKKDGPSMKPSVQTQTGIEEEIDAMVPDMDKAYNAMKAALAS